MKWQNSKFRYLIMVIFLAILTSCSSKYKRTEFSVFLTPSPTEIKLPVTATLTPTDANIIEFETDTPEPSIDDVCATLPQFSPDIRIAFSSYHDGDSEIYILDLSESSLQRLTNSPALETSPRWAPNGSMITFLTDRHSSIMGLMDIYLLHLPTGKLERLTFKHMARGAAVWSPNSKQIAYESSPNGNSYITILNVESKIPIRVPAARTWNSYPAWSPDGKQLAFISRDEGYDDPCDLFIVDNDGTNLIQVTNNANIYPYSSPDWSPDGTEITYSARREGNMDIYTIELISGEETRLTSDPAYDSHPEYSPDGNLLAFNSDRDGKDEIYLMDKQGNNIQLLTNDPAIDLFPSWSSDGQFIAFSTEDEKTEWKGVRVVDVNGCSINILSEEYSTYILGYAWSP
jgi:Tol biopolymer transport system component